MSDGLRVRMMTPGTPSRFRPPVVVLDRGGEHYRGAQVWAIDGDTVTLRVQLEAHLVGDRTCSAALFTEAPPVVGQSGVARVDRDHGHTILAVLDGPPADLALESMYPRDGTTFSPGRIPPPLTEEYY